MQIIGNSCCLVFSDTTSESTEDSKVYSNKVQYFANNYKRNTMKIKKSLRRQKSQTVSMGVLKLDKGSSNRLDNQSKSLLGIQLQPVNVQVTSRYKTSGLQDALDTQEDVHVTQENVNYLTDRRSSQGNYSRSQTQDRIQKTQNEPLSISQIIYPKTTKESGITIKSQSHILNYMTNIKPFKRNLSYSMETKTTFQWDTKMSNLMRFYSSFKEPKNINLNLIRQIQSIGSLTDRSFQQNCSQVLYSFKRNKNNTCLKGNLTDNTNLIQHIEDYQLNRYPINLGNTRVLECPLTSSHLYNGIRKNNQILRSCEKNDCLVDT